MFSFLNHKNYCNMNIKQLIIAAGTSVLLASCGTTSRVAAPSDQNSAPGTTGNAQSLVRITSDPVPEFYPRISPDGKRMVFHIRDDNKKSAPNEKWSIMMMNIGQPGRIPLVGSYTGSPSFFPDSKTILYTYMKPTRPVIAKSLVDGASGINYIAPNAMGDYDNQASVSPDGKKILFEALFGGTWQVATMDMNGMNATILSEGSDPRWHPKGDRIVYGKMVGKYAQIFEYNLSTGQSTQLTSGEYSNSDPTYSHDGTYIAYSSWSDNQNEHLFIMKSDGSAVTQLTQGNSRNGMPCFAPNNDIYFCSNSGTKTQKLNWTTSDIWKLTPSLNR
jgi:TolB protein